MSLSITERATDGIRAFDATNQPVVYTMLPFAQTPNKEIQVQKVDSSPNTVEVRVAPGSGDTFVGGLTRIVLTDNAANSFVKIKKSGLAGVPAVYLLSSSSSGAPIPSGLAPDVGTFMAGQVDPKTGSWTTVFYWDQLAVNMEADYYFTLPADISDWLAVKVCVVRPNGKFDDATDPIYAEQFTNGAYFGRFGIQFSQVPNPVQSWKLVACSCNADGTWKRDSAGLPLGPTVFMTTLAQSSRPLQPPTPLVPNDYDIQVLTYNHNDQTGENVAQMEAIVTANPDGVTAFLVYQYAGSSAPSDPQLWGDAVAAMPKATVGASEVQWQIVRRATATQYWFCVIPRTSTYNTQPTIGLPVKTRTIDPISTPSQPTSLSVTMTRSLVGGIDSGMLHYAFALPSNLEIAFVAIARIRCYDPATQGGNYVPRVGEVWVDVAQYGILSTQLGTTVTYQVQWPWDPDVSAVDSWWTFKAESSSRAGIRNTTNAPISHLAAPAKVGVDLEGSVGPGLQWLSGKVSVKVNGTELTLDSNGNLLLNGVPASKLAGTIGAGVVFAGTLAANVAYLNTVYMRQLAAGVAKFAGDATFLRLDNYGNPTGPYLIVGASGITLGSSSASADVTITPTGITLSTPSGASVLISGDSITLKSSPSTLGSVVLHNDGSVVFTNNSGFFSTMDGNTLTIAVANVLQLNATGVAPIWVNGVAGASGTFTTADGKTATVSHGIITGLV